MKILLAFIAAFISLTVFNCTSPADQIAGAGQCDPALSACWLDTLSPLPAKQYSCRVDSLNRQYVGQYSPSFDPMPEKAKYIYKPGDQDVPFLEMEFWLVDNVNGTKTPITCK